MPKSSDLTLVIKAIDEASATLKSVAATSQASMGQITTATNQATVAHEGFGASILKVGENVIEYVAAYRLMEEGLIAFKELTIGSIEAALKESASLVQVAVDVRNAGLSYTELAPLIAGVAEQNMKLGFTQNDTQLSLGKAILATGNYADALKLNHLAMDLSVAKGLDLNSATVLLQQVMAGNTRVLKSYGIALDSSATSADALNIVQQKVGGSADALAGTPLGHMREVQAEWEHVQVTIGEQLMPVVEQLFQLFEDNLPVIEAGVKEIGAVVGVVAGAMNIIAAPFRLAGDAAGNFINLTQGLQWQQMGLGDAFGVTAINVSSVSDAMTKAAATTKSAAINFDNFPNSIHAADNAMLKHADAVAKLTVDYDKMNSQGATDLASLDDSFKTKMDSINKTIETTQQSIADLTDSYTKTKTDETSTVAEKIVTSEQNIADLKVQLSKATTDKEKQDLQDKLNAEQKNYDSSLAFRQSHVAEVTAAEVRGHETDLQRTIDDYTAKQKLELDDYNKKLATLNQELKDHEDEAAQEQALYYSKVMAINKTLDIGQEYFKRLSAERSSVTTKEVDAEIAQFQALTAAIGQMKSASVSALPTIALPSIPSLPSNVSGQAAPVIAHAAKTIVPAAKSSAGGTTIHFHFNGTTAGDDGIRSIITKTMQDLNRSSTLKAYGGI